MKYLKSVRAFLFCVAAILTVLFAVVISKPQNTVRAGAYSNVNKNYDADIGLTENTEYISDSNDLNESDQIVSDEDTTAASDFESEPSITASSEYDTQNDRANLGAAQNTEKSTVISAATAPSTTKKSVTSATQKETTTLQPTTTVPVQAEENEQMTVYYTKTGKRYHYANPCGKGTYYPTTLAEAKKMGLTPCQKCVLH